MCQLGQFQKGLEHPMTLAMRRATDCKPQVLDHQETGREKLYNRCPKPGIPQARHRATDSISQVWSHRETGRIMFFDGINFSQKASLVKAPTHTISWWNNL